MEEADLLALLDRCGPRLLRLAGGMLRDPGEAADAVQEAFVSAWRGFGGLRDGSDPEAWLATICLNACRQRLRRKAREAAALGALPLPSPASPVLPEDRHQAVLAALGTLPEREREAFLLIAVEGRGSEAAGRVMGCSPGAVRVYLGRARRTLAQRLRGLLEE